MICFVFDEEQQHNTAGCRAPTRFEVAPTRSRCIGVDLDEISRPRTLAVNLYYNLNLIRKCHGMRSRAGHFFTPLHSSSRVHPCQKVEICIRAIYTLWALAGTSAQNPIVVV